MDITELLAFSVQQNASDLHLSAGLPPMLRVDGDIRRINLPTMDHKVHELIYEIMDDRQRKYEQIRGRFFFRGQVLHALGLTCFTKIEGWCSVSYDSFRSYFYGNPRLGQVFVILPQHRKV